MQVGNAAIKIQQQNGTASPLVSSHAINGVARGENPFNPGPSHSNLEEINFFF
jgi:hypothetical protein